MGSLNAFLAQGGLGLDSANQQAVMMLLEGAYRGQAGTVDELTRAHRANPEK